MAQVSNKALWADKNMEEGGFSCMGGVKDEAGYSVVALVVQLKRRKKLLYYNANSEN